jgi:hypothetical protein
MQNLSDRPPFLLNAMYAMACVYKNDKKQTDKVPGLDYYYKSRKLVDIFMDQPSLYTIHALVILAAYSGYTQNMSSVSMFFSMAIRMAQDMCLYQDYPESMSEVCELPLRIQKEIRRRIWWYCYEVDRFMTANNGKPSCIQEQEIKIPLPADELIWEADLQQLEMYETDCQTEIAIMSSSESFCAGVLLQSPFAANVILVSFLFSFFSANYF